MSSLHDDVFAISPDVRYVAVAHGQQVDTRSRPGLQHASGNDSDRYEELLVTLPCSFWRHGAETSTAEGSGTSSSVTVISTSWSSPRPPGTCPLPSSSPATQPITFKLS